ncbi:BnaA08g03390D [Brassica napus]|uniref:BnaA08g03390D protein n=1 Tax=Brassica napus TaxID=3708 RepID=A0A078HWT6_BRANA|nr:BnaA08g03390D [Brassica napus]
MESKPESSRVTARESEHLPYEVTYESGQLFEDIKRIKEYISVELFSEILELEPDKLEILKVENMIIKEKRVTDATIEIIYARLIKHRKDWSYYYGPVKNQGPRDICWAIVAVELATAIRWIKNRGKGIEYSYKELVEFVCPGRGILNEKLHNFCYKLNIMSALEYVIKHGVQEAAWSNVQGFSV